MNTQISKLKKSMIQIPVCIASKKHYHKLFPNPWFRISLLIGCWYSYHVNLNKCYLKQNTVLWKANTIDFGILETSVLHQLLGTRMHQILLVFIFWGTKLLLTVQVTVNQCIKVSELEGDRNGTGWQSSRPSWKQPKLLCQSPTVLQVHF